MPDREGPARLCRYCGASDLHLVLSLGDQPPSNSFLLPSELAAERRYPLDAVRCGRCYLMQLGYTVSAHRIFDDYLYLSSASEALTRHYRALAEELTARYALAPGALVVDVGCNDGVLLGAFEPSLARVGVEPSRVAEIARAAGLDVVRAFFDPDAAEGIVRANGKAALITATNVFAHVDPIDEIVDGALTLLAHDGVFVIEASYMLDLIDLRLFDTIYHEHIFYLALTPMIPFLLHHGLDVFDVERVPFGASGPAFRVHCAKIDARRPRSAAVAAMLADEEAWGIASDEPYANFASAVAQVRSEIVRVLERLRVSGATIGAYAAPAKGNTLLNYIGADPSMIALVAERNPLKQGRLTPGTHIPIVSEERFLEVMPQYALLLAWNYADHFMTNSAYLERGGRFVIPLPQVRIAP